MNTITLRKLTGKSTLNFGKYKDSTVDTLIGMKKNKNLVSIYFKLSKITFIDNILDQLGITEEYRIEKPGTNKTLFRKFAEENFGEKMKVNKKLERMRKENTSYRKDFLKNKNNGN